MIFVVVVVVDFLAFFFFKVVAFPGTCPKGYGSDCTKLCQSRHCADPNATCDAGTGSCNGKCQPGWTGVDCMEGIVYIFT